MQIAMYQPDIPQNAGAMIRLCGCMDVPLHVIEPCGFLWHEKKIRTSAMDYYDKVSLTRHTSWESFLDYNQGRGEKSGRIVLMSTKGDAPHYEFSFRRGDILLAGRESSGVPEDVHARADARIFVPMAEGFRSLNIVNASAMILAEGLRQTRWGPEE